MKILALTHRCPYPPDRGDRARSWNLLRELSADHEIWLGAVDDDCVGRSPQAALDEVVQEHAIFQMQPWRRAWAATGCVLRNMPLTLGWFHHPGLDRRLKEWDERIGFDVAFVYSSAMAPYWGKLHRRRALPAVVDFIDVDSEKWADYARHGRPPKSWIHRRESRTLARYEERVAERAHHSVLVTEAEVGLLAPRCAPGKVGALTNGVDLEHWAHPQISPRLDHPRIIFTGRMDYLPNVDAALHFAHEALPRIWDRHPEVEFAIVGARPDRALKELGDARITVSGWVEDVRPWMWASHVAVAPMRIARGVQTKVLEAMAAGIPVVASSGAALGIATAGDRALEICDGAPAQAEAVLALLDDPDGARALAQRGRHHVEEHFSWGATGRHLDRLLREAAAEGRP